MSTFRSCRIRRTGLGTEVTRGFCTMWGFVSRWICPRYFTSAPPAAKTFFAQSESGP